MQDVLLSAAVNALRTLNWQWGGKGSAPEPLVLPGLEPPQPEQSWAGQPMTVEEMDARLGW